MSSAKSNFIECPVCGEFSNQPYLSYGIKACFSCRAFFRRIHQKTGQPQFKCRNGSDNCQIDQKTRKVCQKCRYDKCLVKGMRPELVMTNDQKKARFRHALTTSDQGNESKLVWKTKRYRSNLNQPVPSPGDFGYIPSSPIMIQVQFQQPIRSLVSCSSSSNESESYTSSPEQTTNQMVAYKDKDQIDQELRAALPELSSEDLAPLTRIFNTYSVDEDQTIKSHLDSFYSNYFNVSFGEDFLKEFIMYSLDVPLSKHFVPQIMDTYAARYLTALQSLDAFQDLEQSARKQLLEHNLFKAVSLSVSRVCRIPTGSEQLRFIMGTEDKGVLTKHYEHVCDTKQLKRLRMLDINKKTKLIKDEGVLGRYSALVDRIAIFVKDVEVFKLMNLLILFSPCNGDKSEHFDKYIQMLRRRMEHLNPGQGDIFIETVLNEGNEYIQELAGILKLIRNA